jgi:hypothetical protein
MGYTACAPSNQPSDKYIELRNEDGADQIDPRMVSVVERMFARCYADGGDTFHRAPLAMPTMAV